MRKLLAAAALAAFATPALAALPPYVYEEARNEAADVIVIEVTRVDTLGPSSCAINGHVLRVERGSTYTPHQSVRITAPCYGHQRVELPVGPVIYQETRRLRESRYGRAYLNGGALARYQYQVLDAPDQPAP
ncbi:MAG TPA: hypothetical protein PLS69_04160 [Terricaulis sp.]|nr:hypothetical protein [Terricaulis sp.]HRP11854.1 hypothetical protein [Terricaulis sp.]